MLDKYCLFLFILSAVLSLVFTNKDVNSCTYTDPKTGKQYDLSPLISSGSYTWNQSVYSIGGFSLDSLSADSKVNISFQLQICGNIKKFNGCFGKGAIFSHDSDNGCVNWGDADVSAFSVNPYKDGVNWRLYNGDAVDHINNNAAIVYFVCKQDVTMDGPQFEHVKSATSQAHFKIFTKYVC